MAKYKPYDREQGYFITFVPANQFNEYSLEMVIDRFIEDNLSEEMFGWAYQNEENGRNAIHPFLKLKVLLYSLSQGITSSRKIETMLKSGHMGYVFLSGNTQMDHSTLCEFINTFYEEIKVLFAKVLLVLDELGLVDWELLMIDGSKFSGNANKELTADVAGFSRKLERYRELSAKIVERMIRLASLEKGGELSDEFIESERKRIERQKRHYESVIKKIEAYEHEVAEGRIDAKEKVNLTDRESRLMKDKNNYVQGYNIQAVYSGNDVIVGIEALSRSNDQGLLEQQVRTVERLKEKLSVEGKSAYLCDKGYCNPQQITRLTEEGKDIYCAVPDSVISGWIHSDLYSVTREGDSVIFSCAGGLEVKGSYDKREDEYRFFINRSSCVGCDNQQTCWAGRGTQKRRKFKTRSVFVDQKHVWDAYVKRMESENGRRIYNKRIGKEHNFNDMKYHYGVNRITRRGCAKANTMVLLAAIVHNLKKLMKYTAEPAMS